MKRDLLKEWTEKNRKLKAKVDYSLEYYGLRDKQKLAKEMGIKIFTIAIGKDERLSRYTANVDTFDEKTLKEIARITGGQFYRASSGARLQKAFESIDKLEKTEAKKRTLISYDELFIWPLAAAFIFLALGIAINLARPKPAP